MTGKYNLLVRLLNEPQLNSFKYYSITVRI